METTNIYYVRVKLIFAGSIRGEIRCPATELCPPLSLSLHLAAYLERTAERRDYHTAQEGEPPNRLFIANTKPYQAVTAATLARYDGGCRDVSNT